MSIKRLFALLTILACLAIQQSKAQLPTFNTNSFMPKKSAASVNYVYEGEANFQNDEVFPKKVQVHEVTANANAPLYMDDRNRFFLGGSFRWNHFVFKNGEELSSSERDVYALGIPFTYWRTLNTNWSMMASVAPSLFTDFANVNPDAVRASAFGIASYQWNPKLKLNMGAAYSRLFGSDAVYPVAGLTYDPNRYWQISLNFPRPSVTYAPTRKLRFSGFITPAGGEWNVRENIEGVDRQCNFQFRGYRGGLSTGYDITKHISIEGQAGVVAFRSYELKDDGDTLAKSDVDTTWFCGIGVAVK